MVLSSHWCKQTNKQTHIEYNINRTGELSVVFCSELRHLVPFRFIRDICTTGVSRNLSVQVRIDSCPLTSNSQAIPVARQEH